MVYCESVGHYFNLYNFKLFVTVFFLNPFVEGITLCREVWWPIAEMTRIAHITICRVFSTKRKELVDSLLAPALWWFDVPFFSLTRRQPSKVQDKVIVLEVLNHPYFIRRYWSTVWTEQNASLTQSSIDFILDRYCLLTHLVVFLYVLGHELEGGRKRESGS